MSAVLPFTAPADIARIDAGISSLQASIDRRELELHQLEMSLAISRMALESLREQRDALVQRAAGEVRVLPSFAERIAEYRSRPPVDPLDV